MNGAQDQEPGDHQPPSDAVEELVVRFLELREDDPTRALETLCAAFPEQASGLRERVDRLARAGVLDDLDRPEAADPDRLGDFDIHERLGGGGMGVVYRATQESLGREVALKVVRPEQLFFEGAQERFQREVTTIARMNHPGIVPIYTVGSTNGVPYFAMERVNGATLADVLEQLRGRRPADLDGSDLYRALAQASPPAEPRPERTLAPVFQGSWDDACLQIARDVAEALEHAHRRGVTHRDVKLSNIMLTPDGRVMLLDFGVSHDQSDPATRAGSRSGTLAYSAPELLAGSPCSRQTDVYALGVTLYALLALELPFRSASMVGLQKDILVGRVPPLSAHGARPSWETEAVCRAAFERDPARRYESADAFARDATNVLERRPIRARRATWLRRTVRWIERHPAGAALASLAVLAPTLVAWREYKNAAVIEEQSQLVAKANDELRQSMERVQFEQSRAERNFRHAYEAVDQMLTRVSDETLRDVPRADPLRRSILEDALRFHRQFVDEGAVSFEQRSVHAETMGKMADIQLRLGDFGAAIAQLSEQVELIESLQSERAVESLEVLRKQALYDQAQAHKLSDDLLAAVALCETTLSTFETARPTDEDQRLAHDRLGIHFRILHADVLQRIGEGARGRELLEATLPDLRGAVRKAGESTYEHRLLAKTLRTLATGRGNIIEATEQLSSDLGEHEAWLLEAIEHQRIALAADPASNLRADLARDHYVLGTIYMSMERVDEARAQCSIADELFTRLCVEFPESESFREAHAVTLMNLGTIRQYYENQPGEAVEVYERALSLVRGLVDQDDHPRRRSWQYYTRLELASCLAGPEADWARVQSIVERTLEDLDVLRRFPDWTPVDHKIAQTYGMLAASHLGQGRHAEGSVAARAIVEATERVSWRGTAVGYLGNCAVVALEDTKLDAVERAQRADEYLLRGAELLASELERGLDADQRRELVRDIQFEQYASDPLFAELVEVFELAPYEQD